MNDMDDTTSARPKQKYLIFLLTGPPASKEERREGIDALRAKEALPPRNISNSDGDSGTFR